MQNNKTLKKPREIFRDISGVLLLDKETDISSNRALQNVRFLFQAKKAGHTGTLDPFATGLLPVCFGQANKFARWMLGSEKTYEFTIYLGKKTDTADTDGQVIEEKNVPSLTDLNLRKVEQNFIGEITQIPPKYSALKVDGQRAYKLARQGKEVKINSRQVMVNKLQLELIENHLIKGIATVSKGTYIRVLVEDIANYLGTVGYCQKLRRTEVGQLIKNTKIESTSAIKMVSYNELEKFDDNLLELDKYLLPIDVLCANFETINISNEYWELLKYGKKISPINEFPDLQKGIYRTYLNNKFVGLCEVIIEDDVKILKVFRLINT